VPGTSEVELTSRVPTELYVPASYLPENANYSPIEHYAIIGDCRSAGLVSREGSLDWLCLPRFDSPSIFAAMLDAENGGRFLVRPIGEFRTERRYLANTNVLETVFRTPAGACVLRDLMSVSSEEDKRAHLTPEHEVLRELEGLEGEVEVEILYEPRPDYGRLSSVLERRGMFGLWCEVDGAALALRSELPLQLADGERSARGVSKIQSGEHKYLSLTYSTEAPAVVPLLGEVARGRIDRTVRWWQEWANRCAYEGPYRDAVVRSALTLKLMTYAPSGALVAAPTTSLPEWLGGVRNWDYRYCWLRDASFTLRALFTLGYWEEAEAFLGWLLHATRLTWPELQVLYDVFGEARVPERELSYLEGYAGSRPVRIGNDAQGQLQLDVYGEVIDAAAQFLDRGGRFDRDTSRMLAGLGRTVCKRWHEPDEGIWEGRSGRFHHTHSKMLCWVALDRLVMMHEAGHLEISADLFRANRDAIRGEIEARGYNERIGSYTRIFDGEEMDASLLTLPLYDYIEGKHPRMRSTYASIHQKLARDGLIYRYEMGTDDGLPPGEGTFGICSFWAVECQARGGDVEGATQAFEHLLSYANDVGLFAEEIDPETAAALGNFPQAFTHIGLINAALTLAEHLDEHTFAGRDRSPIEKRSEDHT
jgi:GH15 family glucan-1,4-alpha-glucosidase